MWNENYVASVRNIKVKVDNYIITDIKKGENEDYEFLFELSTKFDKLTNHDSKQMLTCVYNIGQKIDEKFTYTDYVEVYDETSKSKKLEKVKRNIFLRARNDTHTEYFSRIKELHKQTEKELNIKMPKENYDINKVTLFNARLREKEKDIYKRRVEEQFKLNNIQEEDYKDLIKLIEKYIEVCGTPPTKNSLSTYEQGLFSIILMSYKIYLFIESDGEYFIEAHHTQTMEKGKYKMEFDTINDLLYSLAMNYFIFKKGGYIFCEVCGKMAIGKYGRMTCSEVCKKIRNGSYNKKK